MSTIKELRIDLFKTLEDVKAGKIELDKARTIVQISNCILNSAKIEVDYLVAADRMAGIYPKTGFIEQK